MTGEEHQNPRGEAELYPEILAEGSLAGALNRELELNGAEGGFAGGASHAVLKRRESQVGVILGAERRRFILSYSRNEVLLAGGATASISDAVMSAHEWLSGALLRTLGAAWEFVRYTELQEAFEKGEEVAVQWDILTRDAPDWLRELLEPARQEPRLAGLYPVVSHTALRFQERPNEAIFKIPSIAAVSDGVYRIHYREERDPWDGDAAAVLRGVVSWLESRG